MAIIKDLIRRRKEGTPERAREENSVLSLQRNMNRLFDGFFSGFDMTPFEDFRNELPVFSPRINISENDKDVQVSAELPGMDEKDVTVELDDGTLTIKGEKREEHEEKGKNWHSVERSYGSFHRVLPLPARIDEKKARASFKKGVLTVVLPKQETDGNRRKAISIKGE
ncbi:MAG: molecular chaperone [Verrucomicrobia bacterium]|nr:molecular chaperone [Verrucomicrobiota bacterium]